MESLTNPSNNSIQSDPSEFATMNLSLDPLKLEDLEIRPFSSIQSLQKRLNDRHDALTKNKTRNQYLGFTDVPEAWALHLSNDSCRTSKLARLSYNINLHILIAKIMPGPEHDIASEEIGYYINSEIQAMNLKGEIDSLGSTTVQIGNWRKEADKCWGPSTRHLQLNAVLEIGLSESSRRLALDAHGWLETSGSPVQIVITLKIDRNIPRIIIKLWELGAQQSHTTTRASPAVASCTDEISISYQGNTTTVSKPLRLPFQKVVGRAADPNNNLERDFLIPQQGLQMLAEKVWRRQGFIP